MMYEFTGSIIDNFESAHLIIMKGDANYRRLIGDLHWNPTDNFIQVTTSILGYTKLKILALRTCKSLVGIGFLE